MPELAEQPLPADALADIKGCARQGIEILNLTDERAADPAAIVAAVDQFVHDWQRGRRPEAGLFDPEDAPFIFGSLWGEALAARFGWAWVAITFHDAGDGLTPGGDAVAPAVAAADRSLIVYPIDFLIGCFEDADVDVTVLSAFEALERGGFEGGTAKAYLNLMDEVRRDAPRGAD